ncbi:MAG: c-type cytochrome [Planctomycetota bacterium]|jgi:mono/diheme cytochrome c family protein
MRISRLAVVLFIVLAALVVATRRDLARPNTEVFPDMARSPSVAPQEEMPRMPVEGTIPRGFMPFGYADTEDDWLRAGKELDNPLPPTPGVLRRGEEVFTRSCRHCHGPEGRGQGPVGRKVPKLSMSVVRKGTVGLRDGNLFHIITHGQNDMPSHAPRIPREDRWAAIHHLRALQEEEKERLKRFE